MVTYTDPPVTRGGSSYTGTIPNIYVTTNTTGGNLIDYNDTSSTITFTTNAVGNTWWVDSRWPGPDQLWLFDDPDWLESALDDEH